MPFYAFYSSLPEQNDCHFADDIFKYIFMNEKFCVLIRILPTFVPTCLIDNKTASVQVTAWRRIGDNPLPELVLTQFTDAYARH